MFFADILIAYASSENRYETDLCNCLVLVLFEFSDIRIATIAISKLRTRAIGNTIAEKSRNRNDCQAIFLNRLVSTKTFCRQSSPKPELHDEKSSFILPGSC